MKYKRYALGASPFLLISLALFLPAPSPYKPTVAADRLVPSAKMRVDWQDASRPSITPVRGREAKLRLVEGYGRLPLSFEVNRGQSDERVKFLARGHDYRLFLTATEAVLALRSSPRPGDAGTDATPALLRMKLLGANPAARVSGMEELPGKNNYFIGNDPANWRTGLPTYARVLYRDVYPGVDVAYYGNQRQLEYDLVIAPGADPGAIRLDFEGAERLAINDAGDLVLHIAAGDVIQHAPVIYQGIAGSRQPIRGHYVLLGKNQIGFAVASYDPSKPLIIDPMVLSYSTYLGGNGNDTGQAIAVDAVGSVYVAGRTTSTDFPTVNRLQATGGGEDVFLTKLNASGTALVYSTYLGGNGVDFALDIVVDVAGNPYLTGGTSSANFPTLNAVQTALSGTQDAFVTKLNATGSALVYSTYLGGAGGEEFGAGITVDASGNAYLTGGSTSSNFPTTVGAFQSSNRGLSFNAFVTELNSQGSALTYSTYLGGSVNDIGNAIAVDSAGNAYITGQTFSPNFPMTPGAFRTVNSGSQDAFVTKLNRLGTAILYSTYLGGSLQDLAVALRIDGSGNAYVTGFTASSDFPTVNPVQPTYGRGPFDVFVTKLNSTGSALVYSTYLGGTGFDQPRGLVVDASGSAYVTGITESANFPLANPIQPSFGGGLQDAFLTKLDATGSTLIHSSYFGGNGDDEGLAIAVDESGNIYLTGVTLSTNLPTTAASFQPAPAGNIEAFVIKIANNPAGLPNSPNLSAIPHFAIGGGYVTRAFVRNLAASTNNLTLQFMNQDGTVVGNETVSLAAGQTIERGSGETSRTAPLTTQWIAVGSGGPISASVLFDCCASGSQVTSAVGVLAQAPGTSFTAPFIFQRETSTQPVLVEGLGIVNHSDSANTVTIRLLDQTGAQVSSDTLATIPALGQTAFTVSDLPHVSAQLQGQDTFLGSLIITGTQPFAPVIVGNLGGRLFSLPLTPSSSGSAVSSGESLGEEPVTSDSSDVLKESISSLSADQAVTLPASANLTLIPHFVIGGGYVTRVFVKNLASGTNNLTLQFMTQAGAVASTETVSLGAGQTIERTSGEANRSAAQAGVQWVAIGSDQPIAASVLFDCCAAGPQVTSAVGVLAQAPGSSFSAPFIFQREIAGSQAILVEGIAVANRSDQTNSITVRVLDENSSEVASDTVSAVAAFGQTAFTVSDLPHASAFLAGRNSFLGSVAITGTQAFAPVIVGNLGGRLFSLPLTAAQ